MLSMGYYVYSLVQTVNHSKQLRVTRNLNYSSLKIVTYYIYLFKKNYYGSTDFVDFKCTQIM